MRIHSIIPSGLNLRTYDGQNGFMAVKSVLRVDPSFGGVLKMGDHVRLTASIPPRNDPVARLFSIGAVCLTVEVERSNLDASIIP